MARSVVDYINTNSSALLPGDAQNMCALARVGAVLNEFN